MMRLNIPNEHGTSILLYVVFSSIIYLTKQRDEIYKRRAKQSEAVLRVPFLKDEKKNR